MGVTVKTSLSSNAFILEEIFKDVMSVLPPPPSPFYRLISLLYQYQDGLKLCTS